MSPQEKRPDDPPSQNTSQNETEDLLSVANRVYEDIRRTCSEQKLPVEDTARNLRIASEYLRVLESATSTLREIHAEKGGGSAYLRARAHLVSASALARMQELASRTSYRLQDKAELPTSFWLRMFQSPQLQYGMFRLSIIGIALLLCAFFAAFLAVLVIRCQLEDVAVVITENNRLEISFPGRKITWYLLSATGENAMTPWMDTGIDVKKDSCYKISSSGRINVGIHKLIDAAINDEKPRFAWAGPDGGELEVQHICNAHNNTQETAEICVPPDPPCREDRTAIERYKLRKPLYVAETLPLGRILGQVIPPGRHPLLRFSEDSDGFIDIGSVFPRGGIPWAAPNSGRLWVTVNDLWLDDEAISRIPLEDRVKSEIDEEIKLHNELGYSRVWYDDNVGFFFLVVESRSDC